MMLDKRLIAEELMDDPALDPGTYATVLQDLARMNAVTLAARPTFGFLRQALGTRKSFTLLDVGFGQGDMLRAIAEWSAKRGISAKLVGVDLNENSARAASQATDPALPIRYETGDYADLAGDGFDFVISSLVAHHMSDAQLQKFLQFMENEAKSGWFINDLHRHRLSYNAFPILARILRSHPIVQHDGRMSIARSFRPSDWRDALARANIADACLQRWFPFRLCVSRVR